METRLVPPERHFGWLALVRQSQSVKFGLVLMPDGSGYNLNSDKRCWQNAG
jgi:hypothetical protein